MNLWQNWLTALTQTQQSAAQTATSNASQMAQLTQQYTAQWQQACQQWQQSVEGAWTTPASFWQTVASIQSARARCIAEICQQQPKYMAQLFQCTSYPQLVECLTRWNGHNLTALTNLTITTQAQRSHLLAQWQQQMPFASTSQAALSKMWNATSFWNNAQTQSAFSNFGNTQRTSAQPQQQQQSKPASQPQAPQQQAAQTPAPQQAQASQPQPAQTSTVQQASAHTAQSPASSTQLNLMNNESPTISSTANSVMRAANGNTIAAAAAARRSVGARRVANNRRRVAR